MAADHVLLAGQVDDFQGLLAELLTLDPEQLEGLRMSARLYAWQRDESGMHTALEKLAKVARERDSVEVVIVSPVAAQQVDAATRTIRALWHGPVRVVRAGSSYLGQNDLRLHFGLGDGAAADRLEVTWPSGRVETLTGIAKNQIVTVQEDRGVVGRVPFVR